MRTVLVSVLFCLLPLASASMAQSRWRLDGDGGIAWDVKRGDAHTDQIEMSGRKVSAIVTYGVGENGGLTLTRQVIFPALRTLPNDTHASLSYTFDNDASPRLFLDGAGFSPKVSSASDPRVCARLRPRGGVFDLLVTRQQAKLRVDTVRAGKVASSQVVWDRRSVCVVCRVCGRARA